MTRSRDLANLADGTEFSASDHRKLDGIEASATADQTSAQIKAAVEAATDSNVFTDADHSKLNGVAAGATDNTVASAALPKAGGAMTGAITTNSTFDGRDVAADGVTADAALPKSGGAMTGAITTNSTFDGVDIATRDAVLTSTTTTANAALPKSGGTMSGGLIVDSGNGNQLSLDNAGERFTQISFMHNGGQEAALWYDATDNYLVAHANAGDGFKVQTGGSNNRLVINSSGNVGIGIAAPLAKLDIAGNTTTFDGMAKIYLTDSNSNSASRNWSIGNGATGFGNLTFAVSAAKDGNAGNGTAVSAMVIDSLGRVTTPSQPVFSAKQTGNQTIGTDVKLSFNSADINVGSHYSTSTNRFTAPVGGKYFFNFAGSINNMSSTGSYLAVYFYKNGSGTAYRFRTHAENIGGEWTGIMGSAIMQLSLNDYIEVYGYNDSGNFTFQGGEHHFSGYLLG